MVTKEKTKAKAKVEVPVVEKKLTPIERKLSEQGLHAQYEHYRFNDRSAITVCNFENEKRDVVAVGFAVCSHKDNFCRATGRDYSMKRAFAALSAKRNLFPLRNGHNNSNEAMGSFSAQHEYMAQYMTLNLGN
jgi:hypothetical protein